MRENTGQVLTMDRNSLNLAVIVRSEATRQSARARGTFKWRHLFRFFLCQQIASQATNDELLITLKIK